MQTFFFYFFFGLRPMTQENMALCKFRACNLARYALKVPHPCARSYWLYSQLFCPTGSAGRLRRADHPTACSCAYSVTFYASFCLVTFAIKNFLYAGINFMECLNVC